MAPRLRPRFWEQHALSDLSPPEWEALCDGCGKCCLNKLEDEETGEVALTRIACRLLDTGTARCRHYANRHAHVPECITLTAGNIARHLYWLPQTCAYRLMHEGLPLPDWHPLLTGDPESTHASGASIRGLAISEESVDDDDWEDHIIDEPLP
ncbi:MAG: YcgN family cysteine cluster protein [Rubellimicrobium sp.]|nr:YcgN family cysteine cluster protein [Rubellimicrobium sp.]